MKTNIYNVLFKEVVKKDKWANQRLLSVYHENGYLIATNGTILVKVKYDYNPSFEGKAIDKEGDECKETYMKTQSFFDEISNMSKVTCSNILTAAKKVKQMKDSENNYIKIVDTFALDCNLIITAFKLLNENEIEMYIPNVITDLKSYFCIIKDKESQIVICKSTTDKGYYTDQAMDLIPEKKENKQWFE